MPKRRRKTTDDRRRSRSDLDWFAEDPWADPDEPREFDDVEFEEDWFVQGNDDPWGPIRPRR